MHPAVCTALKLIPACPWPTCVLGPHACHTILAYADGSCSTDPAGKCRLGWSCVLVAENDAGDFCFVGWMAASASHDTAILEAGKDFTSNTAELLAITWAMV